MSDPALRRATRLVRLYPRQWRRRYPDFVEVVAAELAEHPEGARRDVIRGALVERLRQAGILAFGRADRARSGLALVFAAIVPFAGLALGMWSQLHTGLSVESPVSAPLLRATDLMLAVGTLVTLAFLPVGVVLAVAHIRCRRPQTGSEEGTSLHSTVRPAMLFIGSLGALTFIGWAADDSRWYSPAALALPRHGACHLLTLWVRAIVAAITPAWIHPTLFAQMPTGELVAALAAPVMALVAGAALFRIILALPFRVPGRANVALGVGTSVMMLLSVTASLRWILDHPTRQGATPLLARTDQLAPGHTAWAAIFVLTALAFISLIGARRVLQGRSEQPPEGAGGIPTSADFSEMEMGAPAASSALPLRFAEA